jgi:transcription elongation GreA/GreB family factor
MLSLKKKIYQKCKEHLLEKHKLLQTSIAEIQEAINNETKSSAGDKYETAREMLEQDIEVNMVQLTDVQKQKDILDRIDPDMVANTVVPGALVKTGNGIYYIAISIGALKMDGETYYVISAQSPLGMQLMGQKKNALIHFNNKEIKLLDIA